MLISVDKLKQFKQNSSHVTTNRIIGILEFLKFDNGTITKDNLGCFVRQKIGDFKGKFLVDEKTLMTFVEGTLEKEISIEVEKKSIVISDSKTKVKSPVGDIVEFPATQLPSEDSFTLSAEVIKSISEASSFIVEDTELAHHARKHVFVNSQSVCGSDAHIAYFKKHKEKLPEICLRKDIAHAISKLKTGTYSESGNFHFFSDDNVIYGFVKSEASFFDMLKYSEFDPKKLNHFIADKRDIIIFNEMIKKYNPANNSFGEIEATGTSMFLNMEANIYDIEANKTIQVSGETSGKFKYNADIFNKLLKSIPENEITVYHDATPGQEKLYITCDGDVVSLIMGLK